MPPYRREQIVTELRTLGSGGESITEFLGWLGTTETTVGEAKRCFTSPSSLTPGVSRGEPILLIAVSRRSARPNSFYADLASPIETDAG
jgi:hypothetical protein